MSGRPGSCSTSPAGWSSWTTSWSSRCQVFKEKLVIPVRDAQFHCLPAEPKRLEGLDYSLAILDEFGVVSRDSYEVLTLAQGKREVLDAGRDRHAGTGPAQQRAG